MKLLNWQRQAAHHILNPKGPKLLSIYGGIGIGKSYILAVITHLVAMTRPGSRIVISADTLTRLTRNNKPYCDEVYGYDAEWKGGSLNRYEFTNGSTVTLIGYQIPSGQDESYNPWEGMDVHLLIVDEIQQLPEACFGHSFGRARLQKTDLSGITHPAKIIWCGRPGAITHWIKETERLQSNGVRAEILKPMTKDNPHLGPEYLQGLKAQYSEAEFLCLTEGLPMPTTGAIYSNWTIKSYPEGNILDGYEVSKDTPTTLAIDFGRTNPAVLFIQEAIINGKSLDVIVDEVKVNETLTPELIRLILAKGYRLKEAYVDPAGAAKNVHSGVSDIDLLRRPLDHKDPLLGGGLGIPILSTRDKSRVSIDAGISRVQAMIRSMDGEVRLVAESKFWEASKENKNGFYQSILQYKRSKDGTPEKGGKNGGVDHMVDCLRYYIINKRWTLEEKIAHTTKPQNVQTVRETVNDRNQQIRTNTLKKFGGKR